MISLGEAAWPEVAAATTVLAVPLGSCEQHGPHLPLDTDTRIALHLARSLANRRHDVIVTPPLSFGASGEHAGFPGTLSIGLAALEALLVELVRSADMFAGVVFVNGHGGNLEAVSRACARLRAEGRHVLGWSPRIAGADTHAGRAETSMMMAIDPGAIRVVAVAAGDTRPLADVIDALRTAGVRSVSPSGVLGDPNGATSAEGARLLAGCVDELDRAVTGWLDS